EKSAPDSSQVSAADASEFPGIESHAGESRGCNDGKSGRSLSPSHGPGETRDAPEAAADRIRSRPAGAGSGLGFRSLAPARATVLSEFFHSFIQHALWRPHHFFRQRPQRLVHQIQNINEAGRLRVYVKHACEHLALFMGFRKDLERIHSVRGIVIATQLAQPKGR